MDNLSNAIEVRDMSKDFKRVFDKPQTLKERFVSLIKKQNIEYHHVLKNINLDIKKGETVCLIGTNGSGKSTLLKLMTKILYPTKGTVETNGKLTSLLELGAGFHPDFTGRENIYFNASIFGLSRKEIDARLDDIINFSELGGFIDNPVRTYSSGMYMRLAFSIAINVDAEILLIDEILAVGDQYFQEKCYAKLEELRDSDKTIVIVSHSLDVVEKLCDRAIWIYKGEVQEDGNPSEVIDHYLARVVEDHKQQRKEDEKVVGILHIDRPEMNTIINREDKVCKLVGWEVSNIEDTIVKIFVGEKEVGIADRVKRADVTVHYQDSYGGPACNKMAGWTFDLDLNEVKEDEFISIVSFTSNGEKIADEKVKVFIK